MTEPGKALVDVPFLDLTAQLATIRPEIDEAVGRVLSSGWFILGREVERFEETFSRYLGGVEVVGVASGTDALHLALRACDVGPGDEVITVSHSFIATALAVDYVGATPVFVDIDPETMTIDASEVQARIGPRTKAIIPVDLYGQTANLGAVCDLARERGIAVIEDACQAHGATFEGRPAGTLGDVGCFSFYPGKNLGAYGDGGAVVTSDPARAKRLRMLRNYGQREKYYHAMRGYNSRLDEMQAAVLAVKLEHLDEWNERRRRVARLYDEGIDGRFGKPTARPGSRHVYHLYVIRCPQREELRRWLAALGIGTQIHYPIPIHLQEAYAGHGVPRGTLPITERLASEVLSLPIYPELTTAQIEHVVASVNAFPGTTG